MTGRLITLEGIDGAGKSTHVAWIAEQLRSRHEEVIVTREPGGTALGERLRELLLHEAMHAETEALLMFAARREHLAQVIGPALARGAWVLSDRFTDASFAYQGGGRGVAEAKLHALERWVQGELQPHLTLYFDIDPATAQNRTRAGRDQRDRFEQERLDFFVAVRAAYAKRAAAYPNRIRVVDAGQQIEAVRVQLQQYLAALQ